MKSSSKTRVGVVAADPLRVLGLVSILEEWFDLDAAGLELEEVARDRKLQALLIDVHCCPGGLTEVIVRLRAERGDLKIIVIGVTLDPAFIESVIGAGARGYLLETSDEREIRMAIEVVLDGSVWAPRKVLARLLDTSTRRTGSHGTGGDTVLQKMTPREREVLQLLTDGSSNKQIGRMMGIDEVTVKAHLGRMLRKTGTSNRIELTLRALEETGPEA